MLCLCDFGGSCACVMAGKKLLLDSCTQQRFVKYNEYKYLLCANVWKRQQRNISKRFSKKKNENKNSVYNNWKTLESIHPKKGPKSEVINKLMINGSVFTEKGVISDALSNLFCTIDKTYKSELPDWGDRYKQFLPTRTFYLESVSKKIWRTRDQTPSSEESSWSWLYWK